MDREKRKEEKEEKRGKRKEERSLEGGKIWQNMGVGPFFLGHYWSLKRFHIGRGRRKRK